MKIINNRLRVFRSNYIYDYHSHGHLEVFYVQSGQCFMTIGSTEFVLNAGDAIFIGENIGHSFSVSNVSGCKINQLEIAYTGLLNVDFLKISNGEFIDKCINNIRVFATDDKFFLKREELIGLEMKEIDCYIEIYLSHDGEVCTAKAVSSDTLAYLKENYKTDLDLEKFAKDIGYSSRYLRKAFRKDYGLSPIEYLTVIRVEKSKFLLNSTTKKVGEVSSEVGFNTVQYFSKVFKSNIGVTPLEFRYLNRGKI